MASVSQARASVLVWFSLSILSHSLKPRSMPLSSVTLPSSPGLQLSVHAKLNYRYSLLLALNWFNLLWSLSFLPGDLAFMIPFSMLGFPFLLAVVRAASSGFLFSLFLVSFICFFSKMQFCFITVTAIHQ